MSELTSEQAVFARRLFNTKGVTQSQIAKMLGVDVTTIRQIIRTGGRTMDDVVDLTGLTPQQQKFVKVIQRHTQRLVAAGLAELELPIRERLAAINTRVETQLQEYLQRIEAGIAKEEAKTTHEGAMR